LLAITLDRWLSLRVERLESGRSERHVV
jgi:hypothetical protein